jgi:hypothetical protein
MRSGNILPERWATFAWQNADVTSCKKKEKREKRKKRKKRKN